MSAVSAVVHYAHTEMTRGALSERPPPAQKHPPACKQGVAPCRVRLPRRWDSKPHRHSSICHREVGHPLSKPTCPKGTAHRTSREGSPRGVPASPRSHAGREQGHRPAGPRPERHQGRVAQLTHNAALASSGRRAPHSTRSTVLTPSRDEWVGERGKKRNGSPNLSKMQANFGLGPMQKVRDREGSREVPRSPERGEVIALELIDSTEPLEECPLCARMITATGTYMRSHRKACEGRQPRPDFTKTETVTADRLNPGDLLVIPESPVNTSLGPLKLEDVKYSTTHTGLCSHGRWWFVPASCKFVRVRKTTERAQ